jgi:hypothetical protein
MGKGLNNITHIKLDTTKSASITACMETASKATGRKLEFLIINAARKLWPTPGVSKSNQSACPS